MSTDCLGCSCDLLAQACADEAHVTLLGEKLVGYAKKSAGRVATLPILSTEGRRGTLHWNFVVQAMRVDWGNVQRMKRRSECRCGFSGRIF